MPGEFDKYLKDLPQSSRDSFKDIKQVGQQVDSVSAPSSTPGQAVPQPEAAANQKLNPDIEKSINSIEKKDAPAFEQYDKTPPKAPESKGPPPEKDLSR